MLHSAAALLRMAQMEYCGTTSFFIRTLLDKKYALPYRVIDALVSPVGAAPVCNCDILVVEGVIPVPLRLYQFEKDCRSSSFNCPNRSNRPQVDHFVRFADDERQMPVVWHQCMLCFIQRYKDEIRPQDKEAIRKLCGIQHHYQVTPEIIRELDHGKGRGKPSSGAAAGSGALQPQVGKNIFEQLRNMPPVPMMDDD